MTIIMNQIAGKKRRITLFMERNRDCNLVEKRQQSYFYWKEQQLYSNGKERQL